MVNMKFQQAFVSRLELKGFKNIEVPAQHQENDLSETISEMEAA